MKTYCPSCKKHADHKVRESKCGRRTPQRKMSWGYKKHLRRIRGYTSQTAGKVPKFKQSQKMTLMTECTKCKKKHVLVLAHSKKKVELKKKEE